MHYKTYICLNSHVHVLCIHSDMKIFSDFKTDTWVTVRFLISV